MDLLGEYLRFLTTIYAVAQIYDRIRQYLLKSLILLLQLPSSM